MSQKLIFPSAFYRHGLRVLAILILLGGALAQTTMPVQAASIMVTTTADDYGAGASCSLREAIQAANTDAAFGGCPAGSGVDTITLPTGTYTLTILGNNEQDNASGDLDILSDMIIQGATGEPTDVIIRGGAGWTDKVIDINPWIDSVLTVTIRGVTVRDGNNTSNADFYGGGIQAFGRVFGVYTSTGTLNLQNCIVTNNTYAGTVAIDEGAGGLLAEQINLNIDNCTFSNNSAGAYGYGGGISILGINENISIINSTFTGNSSPSYPGGGIYIRRSSGGGYPSVAGSITLDHNSFETNSSTYGGAIYLSVMSGGNPVTLSVNVHNSLFVGNTATSSGRGLYYSGEAAVPAVNFENNWWGCSTGPSAGPCDTAVVVGAGTLDTNPWFRNSLTATTSPLVVNQSTALTASFLTNSDGTSVPLANLTYILGRSVTWGATLGTLSGTEGVVDNTDGTATGNFQATGAGTAVIYARVNNDNTAPTSSNVLSLTVNKANTTTAITSDSPDPSAPGNAVPVTFTVTGQYGNTPTAPTGNVTVTDGVDSCTGTVAAGTCNLTLTTNGSRSLTATYSGDANFNGSTSAGEAHTVGYSTTTAITGHASDPSAFGEAVTVTYDVTSAQPGTPTGNVTVGDGVDSCTGTVAAGSCSLTLTTLGSRTLTASYSGDGTFSASTSAGEAHTVNQADTSTTLTSDSPDPSVVGQMVTFNYSVSVTAPGAGTSTGNVTVTDGVHSCSGTVAAGSCTITFTTLNVSDFTATYDGNTNFAGSTSATESHSVDQAATTTTLTSDAPDPSVVGQTVTFNYSVSVMAPGAGTPTGDVTVTNGTDSCTGTVAAGSCTITFTGPGTTSFAATYDGDTYFASSTSANINHTVNQASTTTTITSDAPDPSVVGQTVTFNYSVNVTTPGVGTPTGDVTVTDGTNSCTGTVAAGSCTMIFTAPGTTNFTATYTGDTNFAGSTSAAVAHSVNQAGTTTTITSDTPDPSVVGQTATFTYSVAVVAPGVGTPTGDVTVTNGTDSCTDTVAAGSCTITFTAPGTTNFTATYAGDTDFAGSTSAVVAHTVNQASTTTTITSDSPDPSVVGQTVTFGYSVSVTAPGAGTPAGNVTVTDGTDSCTGTVAAGSCTIAFTTAGSKTVTATYAGDTSFAGSTSSSVPHAVDQAGTTTAITSDSPDPSTVGETVTVSYTVSVTAPGAGTPSGNVTVTDGADSCTGTVAAGSCTITFTTAGSKTFTATYAGDANFIGSTSPAMGHTVNMAGTTINITSHAPDPSVVGIPLPVTFTVTVFAPGSGTPTGTVTVTDGVDYCTAPVADGTCNLTMTTIGGRLLTASYSGDANYGGSVSLPVAHTVEALPAVTLVNSFADTGDGQVLEDEHTAVAVTQLLVTFNKDMNADTPGDLDDVLNVANYSLVQGASTVIPINSMITYNAGTRTATLDVNAGVALPNGAYTLTILGRIEDTLGAPIGTDFVRHFTVDTIPPSSLTNGTIGEPNNQSITDGGLYTTHFTVITVAFNSDVNNAGGGTDTDDVTNPLNYLLLQTGPDGEYDTDTCLEFATNGNQPVDDDIRIPTGPVTYSNTDGFVATITINGGNPLPSGVYRLMVCGTTSIVDLAGNPLNGGVDSVLNFTITDPAVAIPATGFAPDRVTVLPEQTVAYTQSDLWLEIPRLGVKMDIVGVPQSKDGTWDVSWLGSNAGWLNGSAYPTWNGNSVITGHVVDANGKAGPFRYVNTLWYGDQIIVHAGGADYVYEVRSVTQVGPGSTAQMLKHEELPWVTLVTCRGYDPATGEYKYRVLVRAVLVSVK